MSATPMPVITETAITAEPWREDAICAQTDPDLFFPEKGQSPAEAKALCHTCLAEADCLAYALRNHETFGVWGGTSENERKAMRPAQGGAAATVEERRRRVRELYDQGWEDALIADALGCHVKTVLRIWDKLGLEDRGKKQTAQSDAA